MGYPRAVIEQVKEAVCKEAMGMRELNKIVPVSGKSNLKAEGQKYAKMLREAGVSVADKVAEGMPMDFMKADLAKSARERWIFWERMSKK